MSPTTATMIDDTDSAEQLTPVSPMSADEIRSVVEARLAAVDVDLAVRTALEHVMDSLVARVSEALQPWIEAKVAEATRSIGERSDLRAQQVASELIQGFGVAEKRLIERVERRVSELASSAPAPVGSVPELVGSPAFKEVLDKRFRVMLQHLETEVIPRALRAPTGS